jgi:demethylmenaquinone methyltransferase/2-methoxy-6-polyprenyl-1,4-benzoquinol methylase
VSEPIGEDAAGLRAYYARRAAEYERIYAKPERQADLAQLTEWIGGRLAGRRVLEIACGTGWWTERYAPRAARALATDISEEVLAIARTKSYPEGRVHFSIADAHALDAVAGDFDAVFAGFWWSHLDRRELPRFLSGVRKRFQNGARALFLDNRYVEGSSTPLAETDAAGNTWQLRRLDDGSTHRVLKNFPDAAELHAVAKPFARMVQVTELPYYWVLEYELGDTRA